MAQVFVYGTLMRAGANHGVLVRLGGRLVGEAATRERWTLVDLGPYPAILPRGERGADATRVHGEVWVIDDRHAEELDDFEGCPDLFVRERVEVDGAMGALEAFAYVYARRLPAQARVIATGRYLAPGTWLPTGARPEQVELDNGAPTEDGSPPRWCPSQRGPR